MWGATGLAPGSLSYNFVTERAIKNGLANGRKLTKQFKAIKNTRSVKKADMKENSATPDVRIDPDTYEVIVGGARVTDVTTFIEGGIVDRAYVSELPMAQRYFLF